MILSLSLVLPTRIREQLSSQAIRYQEAMYRDFRSVFLSRQPSDLIHTNARARAGRAHTHTQAYINTPS